MYTTQRKTWLRSWTTPIMGIAALALATTGANAWSPHTRTLVANTTKPTTAGGASVGGAGQQALAQRFETGSNHDEYELDRVEIRFTNPQDGIRPRVTLKADSSGLPGAAIEVLAGGLAENGLNAFYSIATRLDRDTSYWIEIAGVNYASFAVQRTTDDGEDSESAAGWSLANGHKSVVGSTTPDWNQAVDADDPLAMAVFGVVRRETWISLGSGTAKTEGLGLPAMFILTHRVNYPIEVEYATSIEAGDTAGQDDFTGVTNGSVVIPARTMKKTVWIQTADDERDEPSPETFTISITGYSRPNGGDVERIGLSRDTARAAISDNDEKPTAMLEGVDQTIAEGESAEFTVSLSHESEHTITLSVNVTHGETFPSDYRVTPETLVFAPLETSKTIAVEALEDGEAEAATETMEIQLGLARPEESALVRPADETVTVSIAPSTDSERITVGLVSINYSYREYDPDPFIEITASRADSEAIEVDYQFQDITADSPADYNSADGTATIAPGETSVKIPLTLVNDTVVENIERFRVILLAVRGGRAGTQFRIEPAEGQVTILDNDLAELSIGAPESVVEVYEDEGPAVVTLALTLGVEYDFTIILLTLSDTARSGDDYVGYSRTIELEALDLVKVDRLDLIDDDKPELTEELYVTLLRNALDLDDVSIERSRVTVRILDDDPGIAVSDNSRVDEPEAPGEVALRPITLTLHAPVPDRTTVDWATMDGNRENANTHQRLDARDGQDYHARSGTAVFDPGETETTVYVPIIGDDKAEFDKQFRLVLSNPSKGGIFTGLEGDDEYEAGAAVEFPVTIRDTDPRLEVSLDVAGSVTEGEALDMGVRTSGNHDFNISIELEAEGASATKGNDFPMASTRTIELAPGERQGAGTALPITDDSAGEGNEAFKLTMTDVSQGAALPIEVKQGTTVTIIDNDSNAAAVTAHDGTGLEAINAVVPVHEGDGNRIVFALGAAPSSPVTVGYRIRRPDRDLAISGATSHEFNAGNWQDAYVIEIEAGEDRDTTNGESILRLSFATDAPEYQRFAWIDRKMIRVREVDNDNDPGGTVAHVGLVPGVGNGASITGHSFDVRHDGDTPFYVGFRLDIPLQVSNWRMRTRAWTVDNGVIQRAYDLDGDQRNWAFRVTPYNNRQVLLTLNAGTPCGQSTSICTVESTPIKSTFVVAVPGPGTAGGVLPPGTAGEPVFDVEGESVNESDGSIDFTVRLSASLSSEASVVFATLDGTAKSGRDYEETVEVLRFAAGETEKIVTVPIIADLTDEGSESIKGALLGATGAAIRTEEAEGWIVNSDPMPRAWITRFGRTAASHAVDAIADRLERPAGAPGRVALGGVALVASEWKEEEREPPRRGGGDNPEGIDARDWLARSHFHLGTDAGAGERQWSVWGNVTRSGFAGREGAHRLNGHVTTLMTGADLTGDRWTLGIALSHNEGEGAFGDAIEVTKATLTNLHPYVGWRPSARTHLWGVLGMGTGTLEYEEETADAIARYETGLDSRMAAAGVKVQLNEPDAGIGLAGKMDVLVTRTRSERRQNLMPASGGTRRVRLLVEAQGRGFGITPTVEVGFRHDAGDAERGLGIEVAAGVLYESPVHGLRIGGRGHALVAHEASEASEWGLSGTVTFNQDGPGLNLALSPTWGETPERTALWGRSPDSALEPEVEEAPGAGLRASLGYGIATRGGRGRLVPFAETELREGERPAVRFGTRWQGRDGANVEIAVARSGSDGAAVRVAATVRW